MGFIEKLFPVHILMDGTLGLPFLNLSFIFFLLGVIGLLYNLKNFLVSMMAIELMYLGFIAFVLKQLCFIFNYFGSL